MNSNLAVIGQACDDAAIGTDRFDDGKVAIRNAERFVGCGELDTLAYGELAVDFLIDTHAGQATGIVGRELMVRLLDREQVCGRVDCNHRRIRSSPDSNSFAATCIANNVVNLIVVCPGAFRPGHVLSLNQDTERMIFRGKGSDQLQVLTNGDIQLAAGRVVRRNDQSVLGRFNVSLGNCADAVFCVGNFLDASLLLECFYCSGHLARGEQFDRRFQSRVLLANDLIESSCAHSGVLQLLKGAARFHALMLADIADQKHAVTGTQPREELADLVSAGEARFIDKVQVLSVLYLWICGSSEERLQGSSFDSRLFQLARSARGRSETLDLVVLPFRGSADGGERGRLA